MYDGIIFDKDGVLLDSSINDFFWIDKVRKSTAEDLGVDMSIEDSHRIVHSKSSKEVEKVLESMDMSWNQLKKIEKQVQNAKMSLIEEGYIHLFPEARHTLKSIDLPKALVSNAPRETTDFTVDYFDLNPFFEEVKAPKIDSMKSYFDTKKPNPVMVKEVIREIGLENPVMVGDTSADIEVAENAGIDSILVERYENAGSLEGTHNVQTVDEVKKYVDPLDRV